MRYAAEMFVYIHQKRVIEITWGIGQKTEQLDTDITTYTGY